MNTIEMPKEANRDTHLKNVVYYGQNPHHRRPVLPEVRPRNLDVDVPPRALNTDSLVRPLDQRPGDLTIQNSGRLTLKARLKGKTIRPPSKDLLLHSITDQPAASLYF